MDEVATLHRQLVEASALVSTNHATLDREKATLETLLDECRESREKCIQARQRLEAITADIREARNMLENTEIALAITRTRCNTANSRERQVQLSASSLVEEFKRRSNTLRSRAVQVNSSPIDASACGKNIAQVAQKISEMRKERTAREDRRLSTLEREEQLLLNTKAELDRDIAKATKKMQG
jgi:hypothetical protein